MTRRADIDHTSATITRRGTGATGTTVSRNRTDPTDPATRDGATAATTTDDGSGSTRRPTATPPAATTRDRGIDAARAVAILGVVGGHWLVTGLIPGADGAWHQASPLTSMPAFTPISWFLQTLGLFFFTGGFGAAVSGRRPRLRKLAVPIGVVLGVWAAVLIAGTLLGMPAGTARTIVKLVVSPLWFLLPYLVLSFLTGPLSRAVDRAGPLAVAAPGVAVVAASDAGLIPGWTAVVAAWSVPWVLGIALARRSRATATSRPKATTAGLAKTTAGRAKATTTTAGRAKATTTAGPKATTAGRPKATTAGRAKATDQAEAGARALPAIPLLAGGVAALAVLVLVLGYPASAVGVPGDGRSNLSPPSLFAVALAAAQIGLFLLIRQIGAFRAEIPGVRSLNRVALPVYLTHQSVFVAVAGIATLIWPAPVNGLLTSPADPQWIIARAAWLPFLALALAALVRVSWHPTRPSERPRIPGEG